MLVSSDELFVLRVDDSVRGWTWAVTERNVKMNPAVQTCWLWGAANQRGEGWSEPSVRWWIINAKLLKQNPRMKQLQRWPLTSNCQGYTRGQTQSWSDLTGSTVFMEMRFSMEVCPAPRWACRRFLPVQREFFLPTVFKVLAHNGSYVFFVLLCGLYKASWGNLLLWFGTVKKMDWILLSVLVSTFTYWYSHWYDSYFLLMKNIAEIMATFDTFTNSPVMLQAKYITILIWLFVF